MTIRKGDDTDAFGFAWLTVNLENPQGFEITKAEIRIGTIKKIFNNPVFPLSISLNRLETEKLNEQNMCYMAIYDTVTGIFHRNANSTGSLICENRGAGNNIIDFNVG